MKNIFNIFPVAYTCYQNNKHNLQRNETLINQIRKILQEYQSTTAFHQIPFGPTDKQNLSHFATLIIIYDQNHHTLL